MTDIFIKSYNRIFYLDRCIASIYQLVEGEYQITVLDDGTPKKYLDKLQEKYPNIQVKCSQNYPQKAKAVE